MRIITALAAASIAFIATAQANSASGTADRRLADAEIVIDAFYSYDPAKIRAALVHAPASQPKLLFYQGWAQGGNYKVLDRQPCRHDKANEVSCAIKVKDDLIAALGTGYDVTDTFHITFTDQRITAVRTSSNDPPEFDQALQWLGKERPELLDGPCKGFFDGGPTPQDCVFEVVKGFAEFRSRHGTGK